MLDIARIEYYEGPDRIFRRPKSNIAHLQGAAGGVIRWVLAPLSDPGRRRGPAHRMLPLLSHLNRPLIYMCSSLLLGSWLTEDLSVLSTLTCLAAEAFEFLKSFN